MIGEWIGKVVEANGHGLILKYYTRICLEGLRKTTKILVRKIGLWAYIWTWDFQKWNMSVNPSATRNISCKDTFLRVTVISKAGQNSSEDSRCKWKHHSARNLHKFLDPGDGCELGQNASCCLDMAGFRKCSKFMASCGNYCKRRY
jgi:hypothetical protein